jgi:DNA-binding MarR family transcriptional regulator
MLDKLEQRSLIRRDRPAENRRVVLVGITDQGRALLRRLDAPVRECHRRQLGHLSPARLKELADLLRAARSPHEDPDSHWH